jgi:hypothetical protein
MATFTREQLEAKTAVELKRMCVDELAIPGMTKKPKDVVIAAILDKFGAAPTARMAAAPAAPAAGAMSGVQFQAHSVVTKPDAPFGGKTSTTIQVSCGASTGSFPVAGRSVAQVGEFLREVLNVDKLSTGLVNGSEVGADYVLKPGDTLEFLKPAGKKGC